MPLELDRKTAEIWYALRPYLPPGTRLTSVIRSPQDQLDELKRLAESTGYVWELPPVLEEPASWSAALEWVRRKGKDIAKPAWSRHQKGHAFDLAGPDLEAIVDGIGKAVLAKAVFLEHRPGWKNPAIEQGNGCVHLEVFADHDRPAPSATLDDVPFDFA